jgi:hypothetical protein
MALRTFSSKYQAFEHAVKALGIDKIETRPPATALPLERGQWYASHDPRLRDPRTTYMFRGYTNGDGSISVWIDKDVGYRGTAARMGHFDLDEVTAEKLIRPKLEAAFRLWNAKFEGLV